jgi:hypothetical protein
LNIRIERDSVRLRLDRADLGDFQETGSLEERVTFSAVDAGPDFTYGLKVADVEKIAVSFGDGRITVVIPRANADDLISEKTVGFEHEIPKSGDDSITVIVELDLKS